MPPQAKGVGWRKRWDSNPRWAFTHGGFQDRCLKPLGHPSNPAGQTQRSKASTFEVRRLPIIIPERLDNTLVLFENDCR